MRRTSVVMDLASVLVFVGIGRSVHSHGLSLTGLTSTAWPFVAGLAVGWAVLIGAGRDPVRPLSGLVAVISTVALGMTLRVVVGQGTAVAFVLVAIGFFGATMLGWRLCVTGLGRRRRAARTS
jgi:hypothetical protein